MRDDLTQVEMVLIPAGTFAMGGSPSAFYQPAASELPVHTVTISMPFYISRYEVTQAQWTFIMGSNPSEFRGFADSPQRPVEGLNWFEAKGFATAAQMRLPTEAEWEYAYRAGTTTEFHGTPGNSIGFTDDAVVGAIAWFSGNSGSQTRPVGQKLPNGFGLYDMSGNVNEWVNDWFGSNYYAISPAVDPQGPAVGDFGARVYRGGGIISFSRWLRSAARNFDSPLVRAGYVGVRVVRDP